MDVSQLFARTPEQQRAFGDRPETIGSKVVRATPEDDFDFENLPDGWAYDELREQEIRQDEPVGDSIKRVRTAIAPNRHPASARFHQLLEEIGELHDRKQRDYGTEDDPFANVRGATEFGLPPAMGAFIAMSDIMARIKSWCKNGSLQNDTIEDSLKDMAVYALIAYVLMEEDESNN